MFLTIITLAPCFLVFYGIVIHRSLNRPREAEAIIVVSLCNAPGTAPSNSYGCRAAYHVRKARSGIEVTLFAERS